MLSESSFGVSSRVFVWSLLCLTSIFIVRCAQRLSCLWDRHGAGLLSHPTVAQDAAMRFLNYETGQATGTMINIVGASGFHIDKYSFISSEKEVLLEPGLSFIVRSIIPGPTNIVEVEYDKESQRMLIDEIPQQGVPDEKTEAGAAAYGRTETKIEMGVRYVGSKKYKKAMDAFKDALKEDAAAMAAVNIGFCYFYGLGVDRDVAEGLKMWSKAAKEAKDSTRSDWKKDPCVFPVISPDVLDLHGCAFGKRDSKIFAALIEEGYVPPSVVLYDNSLSAEQLKLFVDAFKTSSSITSLDLSFNALSSDCITSVFEKMEGLQSLKSLNLSNNKIGDAAIDTVVGFIAQIELEQLDLSNNELTGSSLKDIFEELEGNSSITSISLSGNECSTEALEQLGSTLTENSTLKTLNLSSCGITSKLPKDFVESLKSIKALSSLNLGDNSIEDEGLQSMADSLGENDTLEYLNLCSNGITDASMESMSKFLADSSIHILNLSMNNLGDEGAKILLKGIRKCKQIEELYLQSIGIGNAGKDTLSEIPKTMKNVKRLSFW